MKLEEYHLYDVQSKRRFFLYISFINEKISLPKEFYLFFILQLSSRLSIGQLNKPKLTKKIIVRPQIQNWKGYWVLMILYVIILLFS